MFDYPIVKFIPVTELPRLEKWLKSNGDVKGPQSANETLSFVDHFQDKQDIGLKSCGLYGPDYIYYPVTVVHQNPRDEEGQTQIDVNLFINNCGETKFSRTMRQFVFAHEDDACHNVWTKAYWGDWNQDGQKDHIIVWGEDESIDAAFYISSRHFYAKRFDGKLYLGLGRPL